MLISLGYYFLSKGMLNHWILITGANANGGIPFSQFTEHQVNLWLLSC
ncbi:hypothetical protein BN1221_02854 [Brenneria goodwinii]|uniref:Uncharacterized protein n=1 Tax=Brenneria goodwinii TaxID=1109412 RepID=A0A0G4JWT1_9GAMM|nr:hypothetical protein BN1221_02854 [Brenneria goodwinii]